MGANPWTEREIKTLRTMYQSGFQQSVIAERLGRSTDAINSKVKTYILQNEEDSMKNPHIVKLVPWTEEQKSKLKEMHLAGKNYRDIAEAIGKTQAATQRKLGTLRKEMRDESSLGAK